MSVRTDCSDVDDGIDLGNKNFKPEKENSQKICNLEEYTDKSKSNQWEYELNTGDEYLLIYAQD